MGLIRARAAHADGDEIAAFTLTGLTVAIVGPVTDTHELIWLLPAVLILIDAVARRRATAQRPLPGRNRRAGLLLTLAAGVTYLLLVLAPMGSLHDPFSSNSPALALILLVNALPWRPGVAPAFPVNRWLGQSSSAPRKTPAAVDLGRPAGWDRPTIVDRVVEPNRRSGPSRNQPGGPLPAATIPPPRDPAR